MEEVKSVLKNQFNDKPLSVDSDEIDLVVDEINQESQVKPKKRRGRPAKIHKITKIHNILESRGLSRNDLYKMIKERYPDEPLSPDAVSRIVSGRREFYNTTTLFRICGALQVTPNQVLDYEDNI